MSDMARPLAGRKENNIEAEITSGTFGVPGQPILGGPRNPAGVHGLERFTLLARLAPRLDLDKHDRAAPLRDKIDLAHRGFEASLENAIEFQLEIQRRQGLTPLATAFSGNAGRAFALSGV